MLTPTSFDVTIFDDGLAGRLCAWRLVQTGVFPAHIALADHGPYDGSGAAACVVVAMLVSSAEAAVADRFAVDLGLASLTPRRDWLPKLCTLVFFQEVGTLAVWHTTDHGEASLLANHVRSATPPERVAVDLRAVGVPGVV